MKVERRNVDMRVAGHGELDRIDVEESFGGRHGVLRMTTFLGTEQTMIAYCTVQPTDDPTDLVSWAQIVPRELEVFVSSWVQVDVKAAIVEDDDALPRA